MPEFVRKEKSDTWHFHPDCSKSPKTQPMVSRKSKPKDGKLCAECVSKSEKAKKPAKKAAPAKAKPKAKAAAKAKAKPKAKPKAKAKKK